MFAVFGHILPSAAGEPTGSTTVQCYAHAIPHIIYHNINVIPMYRQ